MKIETEAKVECLKHWGSDLEVVNAARCSFDKESDWVTEWGLDPDVNNRAYQPILSLNRKDEDLIRYLARHGHESPFFHSGATFRLSLPIYVWRQLDRSRVGFSVNEVSRRYVNDEPTFYLPKVWREKCDDKKQGSGEDLELDKQKWVDIRTTKHVYECLYIYEDMLSLGVCEEQARMVLPLNMGTTVWWSGSLLGWARMCNLRCKPDAQQETGDVAWKIAYKMKELFPVSWGALRN